MITRNRSTKVEWSRINYSGLSAEENEFIREARRAGFDTFWPAVPNAEAQGRNTLAGAREWLKANAPVGGKK